MRDANDLAKEWERENAHRTWGEHLDESYRSRRAKVSTTVPVRTGTLEISGPNLNIRVFRNVSVEVMASGCLVVTSGRRKTVFSPSGFWTADFTPDAGE